MKCSKCGLNFSILDLTQLPNPNCKLSVVEGIYCGECVNELELQGYVIMEDI